MIQWAKKRQDVSCSVVAKFITGHYYLRTNGQIWYIIKNLKKRRIIWANSLDNYGHVEIPYKRAEATFIKDLGNNKEVVQTLYGNSPRGEYVKNPYAEILDTIEYVCEFVLPSKNNTSSGN